MAAAARIAIVCALLITGLAAAPSAQAAFPGENGKIAFATSRDFPPEPPETDAEEACATPAESVVAGLLGTGCGQDGPSLTGSTDSTNCGRPEEPFDGDCGFEIYTMNPDGTAQTRITFNDDKDDKPAWSPDGTKIAFESRRDCAEFSPPASCSSDIYVMDADGNNVRRVVAHPASDTHPTWSPDGTKIAFESDRDGEGTCGAPADELCDRIYVIDANASSSSTATPVTPDDGSLLPAWSPDGTRIAYVQFTFEEIDEEEFIFSSNIHTVPSDGSAADGDPAPVEVTNDPPCDGLESGCNFNLNPTYSPDSAQIAFHRATTYGPRGTLRDGDCFDFTVEAVCAYNDVYRIGNDGNNEVQLTDNGEACRPVPVTLGADEATLCASSLKPAWSPDGARIAFHTDREAAEGPCGGNPDCDFEIFTMNAGDGGAAAQLTANSTTYEDRLVDRNADWQRVLIPPASAASVPGCSTTGDIPVTVTDQPFGSGPRSVHFRIDNGPEQTAPTSGGNPGSATINVPEGRHTLEYWGEDNQGLQETPHNVASVAVDRTNPTVSITSRQRKTTYSVGETATIRIAASDNVGLATDPTATSRRISTATNGRRSVTVTAIDLCGNRTTRTFRYTVNPVVGVAGVRATGCSPRTISARVNVSARRVRRIQAFVDSRLVRTTRSRRFRLTISTARLSRGRHTLRIVVTDTTGRRTTRTSRFTSCRLAIPRFTG